MVYIARLIISGRQKLAMTLLAALLIVFFANYPRITEALLVFLLGGVVPGTNVVLSPDAMLAIVSILLIAVLVAVGIRVHFNRLRRNHTFVQIPVKTISKVTIPVKQMADTSTPAKVSAKNQPLQRRHRIAAAFAVMIRRMSHNAQVLSIVSSKVYRRMSTAAHYVGSRVGRLSTRFASLAAAGLWAIAQALYAVIKMFILWMVATVVTLSKTFWRIAEPRLRSFDAWLEIQVRKLEATVAQKLSGPAAVQAVTAIGREYRKSLPGLHPNVVLESPTAHPKVGGKRRAAKVAPAQKR